MGKGAAFRSSFWCWCVGMMTSLSFDSISFEPMVIMNGGQTRAIGEITYSPGRSPSR